ncbi:MAG: MBL fold metallo-hydrolase [Anaerolineae bacterium]|nr:MBL fold metallo-hydrolase [Anaerolineae bacterium]
MKIKWYAHAAFLLAGDGLRIVTDPYTPEAMGFAPITEAADIVIRSSADDRGHCYAEMIRGEPVVVTATEIGEKGITVRGVTITAIPAQESLIHKAAPADNAMYRFTLEGIHIAHLGDVGNRLADGQLAALAGIDVLFALAGGPPTIDLDDLSDAIAVLRPRVIIPMHYRLPGSTFKMLPVTAFTSRFPPEAVEWSDGPEVELTRAALTAGPRVVVLKPSTLRKV